MKARSVVAGVLVAGAMVVGGAGSASANLVWCVSDPPVQVQTPDGANLTVNVSVTVPQHQAKYIGDVATRWVATPDASGGTLIRLDVSVPRTISVAKIVASVSRYKVGTATATVAGGEAVTLYLVVPTT